LKGVQSCDLLNLWSIPGYRLIVGGGLDWWVGGGGLVADAADIEHVAPLGASEDGPTAKTSAAFGDPIAKNR